MVQLQALVTASQPWKSPWTQPRLETQLWNDLLANTVMQIGGSDQMGNILTGLDLIRRISGGAAAVQDAPCFGMTFPLLTKADGTKMGKSADGAVWLAAGVCLFSP